MAKTFNYEKAKSMGYSDDEINSFLEKQPQAPKYDNAKPEDSFLTKITKNASNFYNNFFNPAGKPGVQEEEQENKSSIDQKLLKKNPNFNVNKAYEMGYDDNEINDFLKENLPKRTKVEKGARIAAQYGLGAIEGSPVGMAWDIAAAPLASKEAQQVPYRQNVMEDIERLQEQKQAGVWDEQDQQLYDNLVEQVKDTSKSEPYIQTADLSIRGLAEKATGVDLAPEGVLEKSAQWAGFLKDPKKMGQIIKNGAKPKEILKAIFPSGTEITRGLGAGTALQMAEEGDFGPIGTMASMVLGDAIGGGVSGVTKGVKNLITKPKETLAKAASKFTSKEKLDLQKDIIKDFRDSGIQADLGTITDNNAIKWAQTRISQSGLTGKDMDAFKKELTGQIKREYEGLAKSLGDAKFATTHEAGTYAKEAMKVIRDEDSQIYRDLYKNADKSLKDVSHVDSKKINNIVKTLEEKLSPGQVKSKEQQAVLDILEKLKRDISDSNGNPIYASVKDLMNNKHGIQDVINYEVQGGSKQLLKEVVAELDRAIISHGKDNPKFAKQYVEANKKFSEHAKTFRNREMQNLLKDGDPTRIINKMNSVHGMREVNKILSKTPQGQEIFQALKRQKLEQIVGDNLIDSTTQQVKLGTFSKLLENGKNRELVKELLGPQAFKSLEKLQKNAGRLADSVNKFYNSSQSGVVAADAAILVKGMSAIANILAGNPWPLLKVGGGIVGAKKFGRLLADPEFLKLVENIILANNKGPQQLANAFELVRPYIVQIMQMIEEENGSEEDNKNENNQLQPQSQSL